MLEGFVPFPPEFAARYREKGYWRDKSLAEEYRVVFEAYADKTAIIDGETTLSYRELDRLSTNLALNLLDLGLKPLDRVVPQLLNVKEFPILYIALQKIGCIPIASLATHRYAEISQFVQLSGAVACVTPDTHRDFSFTDMVARIRSRSMKSSPKSPPTSPAQADAIREIQERLAELEKRRLRIAREMQEDSNRPARRK